MSELESGVESYWQHRCLLTYLKLKRTKAAQGAELDPGQIASISSVTKQTQRLCELLYTRLKLIHLLVLQPVHGSLVL